MSDKEKCELSAKLPTVLDHKYVANECHDHGCHFLFLQHGGKCGHCSTSLLDSAELSALRARIASLLKLYEPYHIHGDGHRHSDVCIACQLEDEFRGSGSKRT